MEDKSSRECCVHRQILRFKYITQSALQQLWSPGCILFNLGQIVFQVDFTRGGILPYSLGGCVPLGSRKSYPLTRPNFANVLTLYQTKNTQLFLISVFCERSRWTGPYTRPIFYDYSTLYQTKGLENHTLSSGTYPYNQYMGVAPP